MYPNAGMLLLRASHPPGHSRSCAAQYPTTGLSDGAPVPMSSPEVAVCAGWRLIPTQPRYVHRGPGSSLSCIQIPLELLDGGLRICCYFYFHLY